MENERDPWKLEEEHEQLPKLEFKPKAHLVLEGSDKHDWGVVKDCHGNINIVPDDAEVVGTWNKYSIGPEGDLVFWVSLQTPLNALEDRATQLYAELAKSRTEAMVKMGQVAPAKRTSRPKVPGKAEEPKRDPLFDNLRARLRRT